MTAHRAGARRTGSTPSSRRSPRPSSPGSPQSRALRARGPTPRGRRHLQLADRRAAGGLDQPRRAARRSTTSTATSTPTSTAGTASSLAGHAHPAIVEAVAGPGRPRHPLRAADRGRDRGRRQPGRPVRPAAVALRQLRDRGDHGRRPPDAGGHRPRPDHQGRGLLPRPPRLGAGLGAARGRRRSGRRTDPAASRQHRHPGGDPRPGDASCRSTTSTRSSGRWTSTAARSPG